MANDREPSENADSARGNREKHKFWSTPRDLAVPKVAKVSTVPVEKHVPFCGKGLSSCGQSFCCVFKLICSSQSQNTHLHLAPTWHTLWFICACMTSGSQETSNCFCFFLLWSRSLWLQGIILCSVYRCWGGILTLFLRWYHPHTFCALWPELGQAYVSHVSDSTKQTIITP